MKKGAGYILCIFVHYIDGSGERLIDCDQRTHRTGIGNAVTDWLN
jgi:outer membrane phospholipase A